jgi:hypothetical protein
LSSDPQKTIGRLETPARLGLNVDFELRFVVAAPRHERMFLFIAAESKAEFDGFEVNLGFTVDKPAGYPYYLLHVGCREIYICLKDFY